MSAWDEREADEVYGREDRADLLGILRWPYEPRTADEAASQLAFDEERQNAFDDWCDQEDWAS